MVGVSYSILDSTIGVRSYILEMLGRDATLTNRTEMWEVVARQQTNPIIGVGFMSFWTGQRMQAVWDALESPGLNQAHNGYLEQYLNLGYVGVIFIGAIGLAALLKVRRELNLQPSAGALRLCFLVAAALYNYTEASFYGINNMWLLLLVACIDISGAVAARRNSTAWDLSFSSPQAIEPGGADTHSVAGLEETGAPPVKRPLSLPL
jgi:O-antigen ligase